MSLVQGKGKVENEVEVEGEKNVEKKAEMNAGAVPSESPFIIFTGKKEQDVTVDRREQKSRGKERRGEDRRGEERVKRTEEQG